MSAPATRISIFGSCVSRDTVEVCDPDDVQLQRYIARQSLISAFGPPLSEGLDLSQLESPFQRRMVQWDFDSSFAQQLDDVAGDSDLLLWDLVDERFGIYVLPSEEVVTRSIELIKSGLDAELKDSARFIPFGSDEHFSRWHSAFLLFAERLRSRDLSDRTRLLALPWANKDSRGRRLTTHSGKKPSRVERLFERYYASAATQVNVVRLNTKTRPVSPVDHRWGPAPYHYDENIYKRLYDSLR